MNISVKDMILAFVTGLVIFSLIMAVICVGIFDSEIEVAKIGFVENDVTEKIKLHKAVIFTIPEKEGTALDFAVLGMLDLSRSEIYFTPIYGDYLINYRDSLSYVSSVYATVGNAMLPEAVKAFSGLSIAENDIIAFPNVINFAEFKNELSVWFSQNSDKFAEIFECNKAFENFEFKDFPLAVNESKTENTHERIKVIDTEKSVANFKSILG